VRAKNVGKKIVGKKGEKTIFIFTRISWPIKGGKTREINFQKHTNSAIKNVKKNRRKKGRKNVFYFHTNIITKKCVEKNARNNFFRNTRIVRSKNVGKNRLENVRKKRFLYSHEHRDLKGGEKRAKQVFRKTRIVRQKLLEKNLRKKCKKSFFIFTRIS